METPEWTEEDRALLLGLAAYEDTLCRCGHPKQIAWHTDMTGWWKAEGVVCHACTAMAGTTDGKPNEQVYWRTFPDPKVDDIDALSLLEFGVNTAAPTAA